MKLRKLIPITTVSAVVASFAPIGLTSCSQFQYINLVNGYTPATEPIKERQFASYDEVCQYYLKLDKKVLISDYIWSLGEYVKEFLEFPEPIFPFRFTTIDEANVSVEDWWTETYNDNAIKNLFRSSYGVVLQLSGKTSPRKVSNGSYGSYVPYSYAMVSLSSIVKKLPYTIVNKYVGSNTTDATWVVQPASDDILKSDSLWSVSSTLTVTYKLQLTYDETITTVDTLGAYWYKDNPYDPEKSLGEQYLYRVCYDAIVYGSYHLMNCTLAR